MSKFQEPLQNLLPDPSPCSHHCQSWIKQWFNLASLHQIPVTWMWPLNPPSCHVMPINSRCFSDSFWEWKKKRIWKSEIPLNGSGPEFLEALMHNETRLRNFNEGTGSEPFLSWVNRVWLLTNNKKTHWLPLTFFLCASCDFLKEVSFYCFINSNGVGLQLAQRKRRRLVYKITFLKKLTCWLRWRTFRISFFEQRYSSGISPNEFDKLWRNHDPVAQCF